MKEMLPSGKPIIFRGAATALITPFDGGQIDTSAFDKLVSRQIEKGISALVVCGTTGESPTLTHSEALTLISRAADISGGRVPIIAGVGSNDTAKSAALAIEAAYAGADAVMAVTPYYNKTTAEGLVSHFYAIADASSAPVIVYNVPSRTAVPLSLPVYGDLAKHDNIVAVKEASADAALSSSLIAECGDRLAVYSGCDEITLPLLSVGAQGVISVVSNLLPSEMESLCRSFFDGDYQSAQLIQRSLLPLIRFLFSLPNPIPVKAACAACGVCQNNLRLPLYPMEITDELHELLGMYGIGGQN